MVMLRLGYRFGVAKTLVSLLAMPCCCSTIPFQRRMYPHSLECFDAVLALQIARSGES